MKVLTKSRFKLGLECPNKLFYTRKKEYANQKQEDPFLSALAAGGFQVEELARMMFPGGVLIKDDRWDYIALWEKTQKLLQQENVIIYETAFLYDALFIRTDILVKKGNHIKLIEVKSKSFDPSDGHIFIGKQGKMVSKWKPYLFDVAFQKYVMQSCFPEWRIGSYIMMADKTKKATINGLNQMFRITGKAQNRTGIEKLEDDITKLGEPVLSSLKIDHIIADIENGRHQALHDRSFSETIDFLRNNYVNDVYPAWITSYSACKHCEFKASSEEKNRGLKSGFEECFKAHHNWTTDHIDKPSIFSIWDFRRGSMMFDERKFFMDQLTQEDINYKQGEATLTHAARQWIQIRKEIEKDTSIHVLKEELREQMDSWTFPLHFIDFETNTVALPFHKGRAPYEQIAFQFSHHIYHENGTIEHANEYINNVAGEFPNFLFLRALQDAIGNSEGSIFRYSPYENTIVNVIHKQLHDSDEPDKIELMDFIQHISHSSQGSAINWNGERDMIDLWDIVLKYYYNPYTKGSNSLKILLPAVLNSDYLLQKKYSQPIKNINVSSRNFKSSHIWLEIKNGSLKNPYEMLPPVFENWSDELIENTFSELDEIADGGAAMIAYSKLQYMDMGGEERNQITKSLLKYCELDTLAMVMVYEHLRDLGRLEILDS